MPTNPRSESVASSRSSARTARWNRSPSSSNYGGDEGVAAQLVLRLQGRSDQEGGGEDAEGGAKAGGKS